MKTTFSDKEYAMSVMQQWQRDGLTRDEIIIASEKLCEHDLSFQAGCAIEGLNIIIDCKFSTKQ